MTNQEAIDQIADITGLGKSPLARKRINAAIRRAVDDINLMGPFWFTEKNMDIDLISGKSKYIGTTELWKGKRVKRIEDRMSYYDSDQKIKVHGKRTFNNRARGNTTTGRPEMARFHGSNQMLEFWPIPADNYIVSMDIHFYLDDIKDLPNDVAGIALDRAILFLIDNTHSYFGIANNSWTMGQDKLKTQKKLTHNKGNRVRQDPFGIGMQATRERRGGRTDNDSGDLLG